MNRPLLRKACEPEPAAFIIKKALLNSIVDYVLLIIVLTEKPPCEGGVEEGDRKASSGPAIASRSKAIQRFLSGVATELKPLQ
jgi:hypothetical protein